MAINTIILIGVFIFIFIGIAGTIIPFIPGVPLVFISILAYSWYEGFNIISVRLIIIFAAITVITLFFNFLALIIGGKYFKASKYGINGAVIGFFLGLIFFPPIGIFIGAPLGGILGEFIFNNDLRNAMKAGIGATLGLVFSIFFNLFIALAMTVTFVIKLI
ncbi:MAG: DUF456 domain-containing protein [Syntrophomonadaceae bacterium]|nr:DUF456 domain-containing protein [Syntrophomonadaceae bacterium]